MPQCTCLTGRRVPRPGLFAPAKPTQKPSPDLAQASTPGRATPLQLPATGHSFTPGHGQLPSGGLSRTDQDKRRPAKCEPGMTSESATPPLQATATMHKRTPIFPRYSILQTPNSMFTYIYDFVSQVSFLQCYRQLPICYSTAQCSASKQVFTSWPTAMASTAGLPSWPSRTGLSRRVLSRRPSTARAGCTEPRAA